MSQKPNPRLYWKDALRQVQVSLREETSTTSHHKWASAYHQAQADLKDPGAVVWLPEGASV